ncbi:hypothetical protein PPACK8108_LOCUS15811 [Phakopsora pachyrhizi]|uniref:Uncharacterized protein n=1 Tax=Phakopsora pachyrhizi TaxID=170000 RepID=A0AAV0B8B3_PHAPC|nr:hypothetical protein PPACK8108_LOCUS15811 [Phakopsora pachyrhizi]
MKGRNSPRSNQERTIVTSSKREQHSHAKTNTPHLRPISKSPREKQRSYRTSGHTNPFWPRPSFIRMVRIEGKLERSQEEVDQVELVRVIESLEEGLKGLIEENISLSREISERELLVRLERKRQLYLIKLKMDCRLMCPPRLPQIGSDLLSLEFKWEKMIIKREMMMAHSLNTRESFSVRQMEYISDLYERDLPDIIDSKTNREHGVLIMKDTVNLKLDSRAVRSKRIIKESHEDNVDNDEDGGDGSSLRIRSNQRRESKLARSERILEDGGIGQEGSELSKAIDGLIKLVLCADWSATVNASRGKFLFRLMEGMARTPLRMGMMEEAQQLLCSSKGQSKALGVGWQAQRPVEQG